jgi:hypothetical protein
LTNTSAKLLAHKDEQTQEREASGLKLWKQKYGSVDLESLDDAMVMQFAEWRKTEEGNEVAGRTIDMDVRALRHVMNRAVSIGWLPTVPLGKWNPLAKKPDKTRLITPEELDSLGKAAIPSEKVLKLSIPSSAVRAWHSLMIYTSWLIQEVVSKRRFSSVGLM